ncbi:MAG: hypothetical protein JNL32_02245 [Candidatus Kapabacteria bacterium]|nr:hypothetical protein [Candidatus Kapabacteria bacterium]
MTKRDFFIIMVKMFGLYALSDILFAFPQRVIYMMNNFELLYLVWSIALLVAFIAVTMIILRSAGTIVSLLKLDKGFDDPMIVMGNLNPTSLLKIGLVIVGGFTVVNYAPIVITTLYFTLREDTYQLYDIPSPTKLYNTIVDILQLIFGLLVVIKYDTLAGWIHPEESDSTIDDTTIDDNTPTE